MGLEKNLQPVLISCLVHYHTCEIGATQRYYYTGWCKNRFVLLLSKIVSYLHPSLQRSSTFSSYWILPSAYKHSPFPPILKQNKTLLGPHTPFCYISRLTESSGLSSHSRLPLWTRFSLPLPTLQTETFAVAGRAQKGLMLLGGRSTARKGDLECKGTPPAATLLSLGTKVVCSAWLAVRGRG